MRMLHAHGFCEAAPRARLRRADALIHQRRAKANPTTDEVAAEYRND